MSRPVTVDTAHCFYPDRYVFYCDQKTLNAVASKEYVRHSSLLAAKVHWIINNVLLVPFKLCQRGYAHMSMPCPGENKEWPLWEQDAIRIASLFLFIITLPLAIASLIIAMPLRALAHQYRPVLQYYKTADLNLEPLPKLDKFHVRTANLSLTPSCWVNVTNDLRDPIDRAEELADSILGEKNSPDVIMVQEGWNEDAAEVFCKKLSKVYPHILHNICPGLGGMDSGYIVLSKHAPKEVKFERFHDMTWQHSMPCRGILSVTFDTQDGPLTLYNLHTQSLWGAERSAVRNRQFAQLDRRVTEDRRRRADLHLRPSHQFILGDLNTARVREDRIIDRHEADNVIMLNNILEDPYWNDHDDRGGRTSQSRFLDEDNDRMKRLLDYPTGTFVYGCCPDVEIENNLYGTSRWFNEQRMTPLCRLDYILNPKASEFTAEIHLRRWVLTKPTQSASSDHAFVDGIIHRRNRSEQPAPTIVIPPPKQTATTTTTATTRTYPLVSVFNTDSKMPNKDHKS